MEPRESAVEKLRRLQETEHREAAPAAVADPPTPPAGGALDKLRRLQAQGDGAATAPPPEPTTPRPRGPVSAVPVHEAFRRGEVDADTLARTVTETGVSAADPEEGRLYEAAQRARVGFAEGRVSREDLEAANAAVAQYRQRRDAPEVGARLDARLDPDGVRRDRVTGRPVDDDETFLEGAGRSLNVGMHRLESSLSELLGQGLDAVGFDETGERLQRRAERFEGLIGEIPISQDAVNARERRERLREEAEDREGPDVSPRANINVPGMRHLPTREDPETAALSEAFREAPGETFRDVLRGVGESAPESVAGLGLSAIHPGAGAAFYGASGTGRQLRDAATDPETGERREVGPREAAAAVASGTLSGLLEVVGDRLLVGRVSDSMRAAGLDDAARESVLREIVDRAGRVVTTAGRQARDEGLVTEPVQTLIENAGAKVGWEPDRELTEGMADAILQGLVGGAVQGGPVAVAGEVAGAVVDRQRRAPTADDVGPEAPPGGDGQATEPPDPEGDPEGDLEAVPPPSGDGQAAPPPVLEAEPLEAEPLEAEPLEAEPLDAEPLDAEPLDAEPLDAEPVADDPAEAAPVGGEPDPAAEFPVVVRPVVGDSLTITAGTATDEVTGEGEAGRIVGTVRPDALRVTNAGVSEDQRGQGHGVRMYEAAAGEAAARGVALESDVEVTPEAARVWDALGRRGYAVERHPEATLGDVDGVEKWTAPGPVFRVADPSARAVEAPVAEGPPVVDTPAAEAQGLEAPPVAPAAPVPPAREEGEAFDAFLGRAGADLAAAAEAEVDAAVREAAGGSRDPSALDLDAVTLAAAERTENPAVALAGWRAARAAEAEALDPTTSTDAAIAEFIPWLDAHYVEDVAPDAPGRARLAYFRRSTGDGGRTQDGGRRQVRSPEEATADISAESGMPVGAADVIDFVRRFPGGPSEFRASVRRPRRNVEARLRELTGSPVSESRVEGWIASLDAAAADAAAVAAVTPEGVGGAEGGGPGAVPGPGAVAALEFSAEEGVNPTGYGARNAVVTEDAYRAALATLGRVAPFSNPQLDPEMWTAAGRVAAFHVEALAREGVAQAERFGEFSRRVVRDVGRAVEPRLRELYDGAVAEVGDVAGLEAPVEGDAARAPQGPQDAAPDAVAQDVGDTPGAQQRPAQAPQAEAAEATTPEPRAVAHHAAALVDREIRRARAALGLARLPDAQRRTWEATVEDVIETGFYLEADALARDMVEGGRETPFSAREHVAVLVRLVRAQRTYREAAEQAREAEAAGLDPSEWQATASAALGTIDLLTEAGRKSGREAGSALSVRALRLEEEAGRFTVGRVLDDARVLKGAALTEGERTRLAELAEAVGEATARADRAEREAAALRLLVDKGRAERALSHAVAGVPAERAAREARRHALREERAGILEDLGRLGLRANDVTGLTAEAAVLVAKLARNVAAELGLTLEATVDRVLEEVPGLSRVDVIRAIARDGSNAARADADLEADARRAEKALERARVGEAEAQKAVRAAQQGLRPASKMDAVGSVLGSLRTVLASFDMSGVFNQAAPLVRRHPLVASRAFWRTLSTFFSGYDAARFDLALRSDPMQAKREAAGLYLAPQGDGAAAAEFTDREEAFASRLLERMPWYARALVGAAVGGAAGTVRLGPGVGTAVGAAYGSVMGPAIRASENHMVSFLNAVRAGVFDAYARAHPEATLEELADMAATVNVLSGRGDLSKDLARVGSAVAFSPRMTVGRFQALGRAARLTTAAGRRAAEALALLAVSNVVLLTFLDVAGGDDTDVSWDVRRGDWGKLRWGSLRIDLWGGYSQIARLAGRAVLMATDARGITERPDDAGRERGLIDEFGGYGKNKLSPWIGALDALVTKEDWRGDPQTEAETLAGLALPIGVQSTAEAAGADAPAGDAARAAVVFGLNWFGVSADAYDDPTAQAVILREFERAHVPRHASAPEGMTDDGRLAFRADYQRRLADKVGAELPALRRIAEPEALASRLKALKADAREEAAGVAEGDPLRQGFVLDVLRRADGYRPSAPREDGLTDGQRARRDSTFGAVMARVVEGDRANLEAETDPAALRERLQGLRRIAAAELEGDPLADDMGLFVDAGYRPSASPPSKMPEGERGAYAADWRRRLADRVAAERDLLGRYGDDADGLKERLKWHAAEAREDARRAAGY